MINNQEEISKRFELYDGEIRDLEKNLEETRLDLQHARTHGGTVYFDFNGKDTALDVLYDIFHYVSTSLASITCAYQAEDGRDQFNIMTDFDTNKDRIRENMKDLMGLSGAKYCVLKRAYGNNEDVSNDTQLYWDKDYPNGLFFSARDDHPYNNDEEQVACLLLTRQEMVSYNMRCWYSILKGDVENNGKEISYKYRGKKEALDALYDIFKGEVFPNPRLVFFYPPEVGKDPLEMADKEKISRGEIHNMMGSGEFGMCSVSGFDDEEDIMPFSLLWSGYSDCEQDELTLVGWGFSDQSHEELLNYLDTTLRAVMVKSWEDGESETPQ